MMTARPRAARRGFGPLRRLRGGVLAASGVGLLAFLGAAAVGLAADTARVVVQQARLRQALDVAALAAGRAGDPGDAAAEARSFFEGALEGPAGGDGALPALAVTPGPDGRSLRLDAGLRVPTGLLRAVGIPHVDLAAAATVPLSGAGIALR